VGIETAQAMNQRREDKKFVREIAQARQKKRPHLKYIILGTLTAVFVIVNLSLYYYYKVSLPIEKKFIPSEHPVVTAVIIDQAIKKYSREHGGKVPQKLDDLIGKYLPAEGMTPKDLKQYDYKRISPDSYELRLVQGDDESIPEIIFSEGGP